MAIRDLLWACPVCGTEGGIRSAKKGEACTACGTRYRRGKGAELIAETPGERPRSQPAAVWADRLPATDILDRLCGSLDGGGNIHRDRVRARFATSSTPIRHRGRYMNRIERFGPACEGDLRLESERLVLVRDAAAPETWRFDELTAVQASSSTLQIKARGRPVVSFRFLEGSARFWEELLTTALRRHYHATGRGEILEFQPRIATR